MIFLVFLDKSEAVYKMFKMDMKSVDQDVYRLTELVGRSGADVMVSE